MSKPRHRSTKKHFKRSVIWSLVLLILILSVYVAVAESRPLPSIGLTTTNYQPDLENDLKLNWPQTGEAAIGVAGYGTIAVSGKQTEEPTASLAKLMTALAVLQKKPLGLGQDGPSITITSEDVALYQTYAAEGGSVVVVTVGEHISEYQALEAMLLPSANNMADTLAIWAFGSISNYTAYANQLAADLKLSDSHFADASGFSPQTVSTASDMVSLGDVILKNPVLAQITSRSSADVPVAGKVNNVNWLLGQDNIIGIKTGNTDQAGGTYLFAAQYKLADNQSITLIGSVMKAATLNQALDEAVPLLNSAKDQIQLKVFLPAHTTLAEYKTAWNNSTDNVTTDTAISLPYLPGMQPSFKVSVQPISPPLIGGTNVGSATIKLGSTSQTTTLSVDQTVIKPGWTWAIAHPLKLF